MEERYMLVAKRFAEGKMSFPDFDIEQTMHPEMWSWLQSLLSDDIIRQPNHVFWSKCHSRQALEANSFRVKSTVMTFGLDSTLGQARAHDIIGNLVSLAYPEVQLKMPYTMSSFDLLQSIGLDCIGGMEADKIARDIINTVPSGLSIKERKKEAKRLLQEVFHISRKKPVWIQEPEWPVYEGRPMKYIRTEKINDEAQNHIFIDLETGATRTVFDAY